MYIIDELKEIINLQKIKKIDLKKIEEIRKNLRESALIIQNNQPDKIDDLNNNFQTIFDSLTSEEIIKDDNNNYYNKYYDTLKYISFKEINKIIDPNYRRQILEKILQEKEIIKKSNDVFDTLLKKYIKVKAGDKGFKDNLSYILKTDDEIINFIEVYLIDDKKEYYFALSETLLYFFEKKSMIYLNNALYNENPILLEDEPLEIFKDCTKFLYDFKKEPKKIEEKYKIKYISKLLCIGYIKTFCFTFIKIFDEQGIKCKAPEKIIKAINSNKLTNIIKLYIYKILFNQNEIDVFLNQSSIKKYKLEEYNDFKDFIKTLKEDQTSYEPETKDKEKYEYLEQTIEKYKKNNFKEKISKKDIDNEKLDIDIYPSYYNLLEIPYSSYPNMQYYYHKSVMHHNQE